MRAVTVLFMLAAARLVLPAQPAGAADNPHNIGSCSACHPIDAPLRHRHPLQRHLHHERRRPGVVHLLSPGRETSAPGARRRRFGTRRRAHVRPTFPRAPTRLLPGRSSARAATSSMRPTPVMACCAAFPAPPTRATSPPSAAFCEECHGANLAPARRTPAASAPAPSATPESRAGSGRPRCRRSFRERCKICHRGMKDDHFARSPRSASCGSACSATTGTGSPPPRPGCSPTGYRAAAADSVVIRPHFRRSLCFTCHANTDDYALRDEDVNALCNRCHASGKILANIHPLRKVPPKITVPKGWPLTAGALTCLTCHDQGHEDQPQQRRCSTAGPTLRRARCAGTVTAWSIWKTAGFTRRSTRASRARCATRRGPSRARTRSRR